MRISVIIPAYNRGNLIGATLDSLFTQTLPPDEIIVVDDGSTDNTPDVLRDYGDRIIALRQANAGRSAARNRGIARSTGDLLVFLDSDDLLPPDSLAVRAAALGADPETDAVYGDTWAIHPDGQTRPFGRKGGYTGDIFAQIASNNFIAIHACMIRRRCLDDAPDFDTSVEPLEDWDFWLRIAAAPRRFIYLNTMVALYRHHEGMTILGHDEKRTRHALEIQRRAFAMPAFSRLNGAERARVYCSHGTKNAVVGEYVTAARYYTKAIAANPFYPRAYLLLGAHLILGRRRFALHPKKAF